MKINLCLLMYMSALTFLSITNGSSENGSSDFKILFGSKMCAFLCRRTSGCSQFLFSESTCILNASESSMEGDVMCPSGSIQTQEIEHIYEEDTPCCPRCYSIWHRRQSARCVALVLAPSQRPVPKEYDNFYLACRNGDLDQIKRILSVDERNINYFISPQMPGVILAARSGHKEVVEFLVQEGADLSLLDQFGNNILHCACMGGDVDTVKYLLSQSMLDINSKGQHSRTPLMFAIFDRCHEVVELLVEEGADLSPVDDFGNNILHCACIGDNLVAVQFLLSRGLVDINARNNLDKTAADLAKDEGFDRICDHLASYK